MNLKNIYTLYLSILKKSYTKQHYIKMYFAEHYALFKKRKTISKVKWNNQQQQEFDNYWKTKYKKISNKGTKLIEALNGVYNPEYFPDYLYATKVEDTLNPYLYAEIYSDKALTEVLYKDKSCAIIPKTHLLNSGGIWYDENRNVISIKTAKEILLSLRKAVVKPTIGGNSGKGVIIGEFDEKGWDEENQFDILLLLKDNQDFIVQEYVYQSNSLNTLYKSSINTFRVISYVSENGITVAPIAMRMGTNGNKVDNIHSGGLVVGVDTNTETLKENAYQLGYSDKSVIFKKHPNSNVTFKGFKIKGIKEIVSSAKILHGHTPRIGIISWDFTINEDDTPVLIEANFTGQAVWFNQITNEVSIFGDNTEFILNKINK